MGGGQPSLALPPVDPRGERIDRTDSAILTSSDPKILGIDERTGAFRTIAEGEATITGSHVAAKEPATLKLNVYDPAKARLVFDPESVCVAVDEVTRLQLYLEVDDDGQIKRAPLSGPGVGCALTRPDAVRWSPPALVGVREAAPFELSASYYPVLSMPATAMIEVVPAVRPEAIRIVPASSALAPGQTIALKVEEQLPGAAEAWREVNPGAITWTAPPRLVWSPATVDLLPTATVPENPPREFELAAGYGGREARGVIRVKQQGLDPNDPDARVFITREPEGEYLPVGRQQRFSMMVEKDGVVEPATDVTWPEDFENDYVRWQAPVLTAKQPGYQQWFRAQAGDRNVLWHASTYVPGRFDVAPPREDRPVLPY